MNKVLKYLKKCPIDLQKISEILSDTDKHYRIFFIPKKNHDGKRLIAEPDEELKMLQNSVLPLIQKLPKSKYCAAYEKGCSVKKNAKKHRKNLHILHADIKNFFPSTDWEIFKSALSKYFDPDEMEMLWRICSYKGGLPIGASTSPLLSNRIMRQCDKKMKRLSFSLKFTRYADDMIFSSKKYIEKSLIDRVADTLSKFGYRLNYKKTFFMSKRREVTGVIITEDQRLSTGTTFKKQLKKDLYNLIVKGKGRKDCITGKLAYLYDIEPLYAEKLYKKYSLK